MIRLTYEGKKQFIVNILYIVTVAAVIYFIVKYLLQWTLPFFLGFLIVLILQPITNAIAKKTAIRNKTARCFVITGFYLVVALFLWLISLLVMEQLSNFISTLPSLYSSAILPLLEDFSDWVIDLVSMLSPDIASTVSQSFDTAIKEISTVIAQFSAGIISSLTSGASRIPMFLITLLFTIMCSIFISLNFPKVTEFLMKQLPPKGRDIVGELRRFLSRKISKVGKAYFLIMCITFAELSLGLSILRVEYAFMVAGIIALLDILPFIGSGLILIPWALISLFTGDMHMGVGLFVLYAVITVIRNIIEPKIVGEQIGLHPLVTLTAMYAGLRIFGFIGFILAPITVLFLIHLNQTGYIRLWK